MATIPENYQIQASGDYEIPGLFPGKKYLLTLKTTFPAEGTALINFNNGVDAAFVAVDNPEMLGGTGITERRLLCPSSTMQINLDATFTDSIQVTIIPEDP